MSKLAYFSESPGDLTNIVMQKQIVIRLKNACVKNESALLTLFQGLEGRLKLFFEKDDPSGSGYLQAALPILAVVLAAQYLLF